MQARVVMLVDFDYFFAQCEELRNPALKDKPVVVGVYSGRTEDSGAVSTANYVARKIMHALRGYADSFEQMGIDEAYLDVTQKVRGSFEAASDLARKMKTDV